VVALCSEEPLPTRCPAFHEQRHDSLAVMTVPRRGAGSPESRAGRTVSRRFLQRLRAGAVDTLGVMHVCGAPDGPKARSQDSAQMPGMCDPDMPAGMRSRYRMLNDNDTECVHARQRPCRTHRDPRGAVRRVGRYVSRMTVRARRGREVVLYCDMGATTCACDAVIYTRGRSIKRHFEIESSHDATRSGSWRETGIKPSICRSISRGCHA
jgi:hypothetical protein